MNTVATNSLGFSGSISEYFQLLLTIFFVFSVTLFASSFWKLKLRHYLVTPSTVYHGTCGTCWSVSWKNVSLGWIQISLESVSIYFVEPCNLTWLTILESSSVYKPFKRKLLHTSSFNLQGIWSTCWHSKDRTYLWNIFIQLMDWRKIWVTINWKCQKIAWMIEMTLIAARMAFKSRILRLKWHQRYQRQPNWIDLRLSRMFCWFSSR